MKKQILNKYLVYLIGGIIALFSIAKMLIVLQQYSEKQDHTPLAPICMLLFEIVAVYLIIRHNPKHLLETSLNKRVFLFWVLSGTIALVYGFLEESKSTILLYVSLWETGFFTTYYISRIYRNTLEHFSRIYILLAIPLILLFIYSNFQRGLLNLGMSKMGNNAIFYIVTLSPWVLISRDKYIRTGGILFIALLCLLSLKRSALIMATLTIAFFFYFEYFKKAKNIRSLLTTLAIAVAAITLLVVVNRDSSNMAMERMQNISEDSGSGRTDHWEMALFYFGIERNPISILTGHGYCAVEQALGKSAQSAHNDFIEVLYDYGVIGFLLYLSIHICLIRRMVFLIRRKSFLRTSYTASYIVFFMMTMVSHLVIYPSYFLFLATYWGATERIIYNEMRRERAKRKHQPLTGKSDSSIPTARNATCRRKNEGAASAADLLKTE